MMYSFILLLLLICTTIVYFLYSAIRLFNIQYYIHLRRLQNNLKTNNITLTCEYNVDLTFNFNIIKPNMLKVDDITSIDELEKIISNHDLINHYGINDFKLSINTQDIEYKFGESWDKVFRRNLSDVGFIWSFKITLLNTFYPSSQARFIYMVLDRIIEHNNYYVYYN